MSHPGALQYLDDDGASIAFRDEGTGPALVLVHGWLLDSTQWDAPVTAWRQHFRVLRTDRRGFGASSGTPGLARDAADIVRLLDRLGIRAAGILGMSQGARIALHLADSRPERVTCLVLDGTPPLAGLPGNAGRPETPLSEYRERLARLGIGALRAELGSHPLMQLRSADPAARRALHAMLARYSGADLEEVTDPTPDVDAARLARLDLPVLLLNGALDSERRLAAGDALARLVPGAERCLIPQAGHLACLDSGETYGAVVLEFLTRHLNRWAATPGETP
jgi:pimeloyl-ACP methyl ester carboxylesterase